MDESTDLLAKFSSIAVYLKLREDIFILVAPYVFT